MVYTNVVLNSEIEKICSVEVDRFYLASFSILRFVAACFGEIKTWKKHNDRKIGNLHLSKFTVYTGCCPMPTSKKQRFKYHC